MKLLMICLASLFVLGCGVADVKIPRHENVFYSYSHRFQTCREFNFEIDQELNHVGRYGEPEDVDVEMCDNITGPKNDAETTPGWPSYKAWLENLFDIAEDASGKKYKRPDVDLDFD